MTHSEGGGVDNVSQKRFAPKNIVYKGFDSKKSCLIAKSSTFLFAHSTFLSIEVLKTLMHNVNCDT